MNPTDTFFNRDHSLAKVNMAMNYLSRLVRENMTIFDYNSQTGEASFLTNSDKLVSCVVVNEGGNVSLQEISVKEATDTFSNERVDEAVNGYVGDFITSLQMNEYGGAEKGFSDLLGAFESRSKINESRSKLERRRGHFGDAQEILSTPEYTKLVEVREKVVEYLKENKETLIGYEDVANSVKLTNALGKAFNLPRTSWDTVVKEGRLNVPYDSKKTVFEMICTQELIRSELTESKENFSRSWIKNPKIAKLASCIYNDNKTVLESLKEAVAAVPYLALASKSDIKTVFASIYESSDVANISQKDIREYVARIFEFKKPIKKEIIGELNESYGINVQNLKFVPTFSNLAKAQSVLFEALNKIGTKDTVVKDVFCEMAKILRKKNGIETLDVNDFIFEAFTAAGIQDDTEFFRAVNLDEVVEAVLERKKDDGQSKGDKGKDKKDPKAKDFENGGDREGDDSDTKPGKKDFETKKGKSNFGGNKGDASKTVPGKEDFEDGDAEAKEKDEFPVAKGKDGKKKKKKPGKGAAMTDDEADASADQSAYDESVEYAEPEEETDHGSGLSDEGMSELMGELENLFKEIDWEAIADDEEEQAQGEESEQGSLDYNDEMTDRETTPNEFSDEEVGTPDQDDMP